MNGIHDMGGMHGFGPIPIEADEPLFHADWEPRVLAMMLAVSPHTGSNLDRDRFRIEQIPPAQYLASSYYERWLECLITGCRHFGLLSDAELDAILRGDTPQVQPAETSAIPSDAMVGLLYNAPADVLDFSGEPQFGIGDRVRARNLHPEGHTRLVRYARGRIGEVISDHGNQLYPDDQAALRGPNRHRLYTVRFAATELWGDSANARDSVCIELWEPYLEPA